MARSDDDEMTVWDSLHKHDKRLTTLEIELASAKEINNMAMNNLVTRQDKHEEKFELTFDKMTDALIEIKGQLIGFMSAAKTADDTRLTALKLVIGIAIPLAAAFSFLVREYILHHNG